MGRARESFKFYRANFSLFLALSNISHVFLDETGYIWEFNWFLLLGTTPSTETTIIKYQFDREVSHSRETATLNPRNTSRFFILFLVLLFI